MAGQSVVSSGDVPSVSRKVNKQEGLFPSCRFCACEAITTREIASQDGVEVAPVCQWHDAFFGWMYGILGNLVRERLAIKELAEKEFHSKFG